ncbi:putative isochorismatase [Rubripirellula lacrimiformis]|uniref:Putative isochorismatase n=1 Tax=Rubripirellula lacrimiformis TaxID=1930273 RepID=A0A517NFM9_9BACT|nr:isochorismatase family protein [Rubripirellula lacrimiformis]QDT05942.1 putative isochorismatase [Rubripirellula lacrimiformis]
MPAVRSPHLLDAARSGLLVIDIQEKLVPAIPSADNVIRTTERLVQAAEILDIPAAATVQYPKGLGGLVQSLADQLPAPEEKLDFSAAVCRDALDRWCSQGRDQIVIAGIETHICVLQTALDLLAEGLRVFVVAEAVAARGGRDHDAAIDWMAGAGVTITTFESAVFQWCRTASHPQFKSISRLVKS